MSGTVLTLSEVSYRYNEESRIIFSNVDLSATMQSICIVGENGAGKTTLLKIIMEMMDPWKGTRVAHRNIKFGYFTQHFVDQIDHRICPVEVMQKEFPGKKVEEYRRMLGQFGVTGDKIRHHIPVCTRNIRDSRFEVIFEIIISNLEYYLKYCLCVP